MKLFSPAFRHPVLSLLTGFLVFSTATVSAFPPITEFSELVLSPSGSFRMAGQKLSSQVVRDTDDGAHTSVVILMSEQADLSYAYEIENQDERGWYVYQTLVAQAAASQKDLIDDLDRRGVSFKSFWVANMVIADVDRKLAVEIAGRPDVARLDSNRAASWIEPPEIAKPASNSFRANQLQTIEWGVNNVNAPALWALGFNGTGIVVAGLDTGIRWTHTAIRPNYRGWNGTSSDHNFNWHDAIHSGGGLCGANTVQPCDDNGHGSHTLGTMVGDDGAGNQVGVAPGAKWIGCRNMDQGNGTPATYSECFQFMIAPTDLSGNNANPSLRPHIVNNSWGCPASEGCTTRAELETIVNNTQAAGIFVQSSAGNSGPGCSTVSEALAIYDASFAAGAIDINNNLTSFSSRGPSTYYTPNLSKPNISAPGANVRSLSRSSDTAFMNLSGTSMASPHVGGVVALLWSARPALVRNIAATKTLLQNTANPGVIATSQTCGGIASTQIPNNTFGFGRVDALAAYNASSPTLVSVSGRILSPEGIALRNIVVSLIDANNVRRTATTSSFGLFTFEGVRANESYTLTASSKRYRFPPQAVSVGPSNFSTADIVGAQ